MALRGKPRGRDVSEARAKRMLNVVLDAGINFIDTSIDYDFAEERIGRYVSHRRAEYYLATKCGCLVGDLLTNPPPARPDGRRPHVFTPENIRAGVEQSLRRVKTDDIDVLQFHASPPRRELEELGAVETVLDLKQQGKVRFIGMSGIVPNLSDHIAMGVFDEFQIPYSALQREHEDLIAEARMRGRASSFAVVLHVADQASGKATSGRPGRASVSRIWSAT